MSALLDIRDLTVDFTGPRAVRAVDGIELAVASRERVAIVGESGSGKSQILLACTDLLAANGRAGGSAKFDGEELIGAGGRAGAVRGKGIGFVFQDAGGSLTPHRRVGDQLAEVAASALGLSRAAAESEALEALARVQLPEPRARATQYPHELSGGMRQRVAIALALVTRPRMLFADEPTTALDVTVQAEILALIDGICRDLGMALLLVTHDMGVVAALADRVAVMRAGHFVETSTVSEFLRGPRDPYSRMLLEAVPTLEGVA